MKKDHFGLGFGVAAMVTACINAIPYLFAAFYFPMLLSTHDEPGTGVPEGWLLILYTMACGVPLFIATIVFGVLGLVLSKRRVTRGLSIAALIINMTPFIIFFLGCATGFLL